MVMLHSGQGLQEECGITISIDLLYNTAAGSCLSLPNSV